MKIFKKFNIFLQNKLDIGKNLISLNVNKLPSNSNINNNININSNSNSSNNSSNNHNNKKKKMIIKKMRK